MKKNKLISTVPTVNGFLSGKSEHTISLFWHFVEEFNTIGHIELHPTKSMIGIATAHGRIAWITQLGKNFIHIVFPLKKPHPDNLCFQKIAQVPGDDAQFNHHFRMCFKEDINEEITSFMELAYQEAQTPK